MSDINKKSLITSLRSKTNAGILACKKALEKTDYDFNAAHKIILEQLGTSSSKIQSREAGQLAVVVAIDSSLKLGAIVSFLCQTDFVAKSADFCKMCDSVAKASISCSDLDQLKSAPIGEGTVADEITRNISVFRENIILSSMKKIVAPDNGIICSYVHGVFKREFPVGKMASLVSISGDSDDLKSIGEDVAMHIVASNPLSVDIQSMDPEKVAFERSIHEKEAKDSGKPENVCKNIVEGKMRKYYQQVVLLEQACAFDMEKTVKQFIGNLNISDYIFVSSAR